MSNQKQRATRYRGAGTRRGGMVVRGAKHVGKSRSMRRIVASLSGSDEPRIVTATPTIRNVELGALLPIIVDLPNEPMAAVQIAQLAYREFLPGRPHHGTVLGVDDAEHLDSLSVTVLDRVIREQLATVVLVWPLDRDFEPWLEDLVVNDRVNVRTVEPLNSDEVHSWLVARHPAIGARSIDRLNKLSAGNPWILEQLCGPLGDRLVRLGDKLELPDEFGLSDELARELDERLAVLGRLAKRGFDVLAVAGEIEWSILAEVVTGLMVEQLEDVGFATVVERQGRSFVRPSDALLARYSLSSMPASQHRRIAAALSAVIEDLGSRRRDDALRLADWGTSAGLALSADLLRQAASHAIRVGDASQAERFARRSLEVAPSNDATLSLTRALVVQRRFATALDLIDQASADATTDEERLGWIQARCDLAVAQGNSYVSAMRFCDELGERIVDPGHRALASLERAHCDSIIASPVAFLAATEALQGHDDVRALLARAGAAVRRGRYETALATLDVVDTAHPLDNASLDAHSAAMLRVEALVGLGRLPEALTVGQARRGDAAQVPSAPMAATWTCVVGWLLTLRGDHDRGLALLANGLSLLSGDDPLALRTRAVARYAIALAETGGKPEARAALALVDADAIEDLDDRALVRVAKVWADADGAAVADLVPIAKSLVDLDHVHTAWTVLDHALRCRMPAFAVAEIMCRGEAPDGTFACARRNRAMALDTFDPAALLGNVSTFVELGMHVDAVETTALAVALMANDHPDRLVARARLDVLRSRCRRLDTPLMAAHEPLLTARQVEVAGRASRATSSEIADELSISVRTVDNHLQAVYSALRVHDRHALGELLGGNYLRNKRPEASHAAQSN